MSNIISSLGGGSGIDTTSLISGLVEVERAPTESRLDSRQEKLEAQISAYGTLKSALSTFQGLLAPLADNDTFNSRTVAFPDTDIVTPNSLDAGAQVGTYQISVEEVAASQSLALAPVADSKSSLGVSGNLSFQFGEWIYDGSDNPLSLTVNDDRAVFDVEVLATDTLESLAEKINANDSGVQAGVLSVDGQYQLLITAPSGAANALQITSDDASLVGYEFNATNYAGYTETQQGADASLYINGLLVDRETNEIDDVIPGFNFTLNKKSPGEKLTFTVEAETATAEQAVRDFVEGYNLLYETISGLVGVSKDPETNADVIGGLFTDGSAKTLFSQLRSLISQTVPGVEDGFTALTNIGIRTELDGTISIDEDDFSSAFTNNFALVESLFASNFATSNPYVDVKAGSYVARAIPGSYGLEITTDPSKGGITGIGFDAANLDFNSLTDSFNSPPLVTTLGDTYSFKVRVNGTESDTIQLIGSYASIEEVRAELQSLINGDDKLSAVNAKVDVTYDSVNDSFSFTSREWGSSSKVSFAEAGVDMANFGITTTLTTGTAGVDVAGTLGGTAGFGSGNVLLPDLDSDVYGLNFTVRAGATAVSASTLNFSRGFAGEMSLLIDRFLGASGIIATREENINNQLDDVADDREELDRRIEKYEARISAQFLAMEQIISGLNATSSSLDGILERLVFTASKN